MGRVFKWALGLAGLALFTAVIVALVDAARPVVPAAVPLSAQDEHWAHQWLRDHDPRRYRAGARITLTLSQHEINTLANYLIGRLGSGRAMVRLTPGVADVRASLGLPWNPANAFLNLTLRLSAERGLPRVEEARVAGLRMPAGMVQMLVGRGMEGLTRTRLLRDLSLKEGLAVLVYEWHPDAVDAIGTHLLPEDEQERLRFYQAEVMKTTDGLPRGRGISLSGLLASLFVKAASRSTQGDAIGENRAVLAVAAAYANGRTVRDLDSGAAAAPRPRFHRVTLRGRRDLAQHFTASAALAAQGSSVLSDAVGLFKELTDTDSGSGFSFVDLTADRAGVRFAELATGSDAGAVLVQRAALRGLSEDDFMPEVDGLPEGISKQEFERDYGGAQGPRYRALVEEIDRRIAMQRIYAPFQGRQSGPG